MKPAALRTTQLAARLIAGLTAWPPLVRLHGQVAAMPERDRFALLGAGLALLAAAEWFVVWPLHQQHDTIVNAARVEAQAARDSDEQAQQAQQQVQTALQERTRLLDAELVQLGAARRTGQRLSTLLARTLQPLPVHVTLLREVGVEEIESPATAALAGSEGGTASGTSGASGTAHSAVLLYRHRFELRLDGPLQALLDSLKALEADVRPLRIERVKLTAIERGEVQLSVVLVGVGTERTWLSL